MPQLGAMIGGMIGNYVSPDVINGPSIGDAQQQTAQAGVPRPVVYGHPAPFAGNIIDGEAKARKIKVKRRDDGKGNQTITKEEHFIMTYAIRICEGEIAGIARAWRNGKVVIDNRADSMIPPYANGDVAARGMAIAEGRAATLKTMQKVRVYLGTESQLPDPALEALHGVGNTPSYRGTAYIVIVDDDVTDSGGAAAQWQFEVIGVGAPGGDASVEMASTENLSALEAGGITSGFMDETQFIRDASSVASIYKIKAVRESAYSGPSRVIIEADGGPINGAQLFDSGWMVGSDLVHIDFQTEAYTRVRITPPVGAYTDLIGTDKDNYIANMGRASLNTPSISSVGYGALPSSSVRVRIIRADVASAGHVSGASVTIRSVNPSELPASYRTSPDVPGQLIGDDGKLYYPDWDTGAAFSTIEPTAITVAGIVDDLANRSGVVDSKIDTSAIAVPVPGMLVATQCTASEAVKPLQQIYFFDLPEYDGKIRAVVRGGAIKATVTDADMVFSEGDTTRAQHVEFPLAVTVVCRSPEAEYSPLPQTSRRSSNNVTALGESRIESPVPMSPDEAMQRADILQKAMWARAEGTAEKWLPDQWSKLVPSDCIAYNGKRWLIENVSLSEGKMKVTMANDRADAYQSTALAAPIRQPEFPLSGLAEPTTLAVMQMPAIRSADTGKTGIYVAARGATERWQGCDIQISIGDTQFPATVATVTVPAEMGTLSAAIGAGDTTASVTMQYGDLFDTNADGLVAGQNGAGLVGANGITEAVQYLTATEGAPDAYALGGMVRGRASTDAAAHAVGTPFITLEDAVFIPISSEHVGKTIYVRAATSGTDPATAAWQSIVLDPPVYVLDGGGA